jgi:hypothetical protein
MSLSPGPRPRAAFGEGSQPATFLLVHSQEISPMIAAVRRAFARQPGSQPQPQVFNSLRELGEAIRHAKTNPGELPAHLRHLVRKSQPCCAPCARS